MRTLLITISLLASLAIAPAQAADVEDPNECKEISRKVIQGVIVYVESDCSTQVDVDIQDCLWGGYWDTTSAGPLTVRVWKCSPPTETEATAATELAGPCPSEKNLGVGTLALDPSCNAQLDIKFYECIWGGHWRSVGGGPATIRVYQCDARPPTHAASPCSDLDGSTWAVSFEGESDCSFRIHAIDGHRVCPDRSHQRVGAGAGPVRASADTCTLS